MDYSLVSRFQDFIGNVYEIYGSIESLGSPAAVDNKYISALLINIVQDADMAILEQSIKLFNHFTYPEYKEIFI